MFFFIFREYRDIIKKSNLGDGLGGILGDNLGAKKNIGFLYTPTPHLPIYTFLVELLLRH